MYTKAEKLIHAVKRNPVLYDTTNVDYCKTKVKDEKWKIIAETLNIESGSKARAEWTKLRDCHRDALRRQEKKRKSGSGAGVRIKPWIYQKQMEFLIPFMTSSGTADDTEIVMITDGEEESVIYSDMPVVVIDATPTSDDHFQPPEIGIDHSYNSTSPPPPPSRNKRLSKYELLKEMVMNGEDISNGTTVELQQLSQCRSTFEMIHGRVGSKEHMSSGIPEELPAKKQRLSKYEALQERVMSGDISTGEKCASDESEPKVALRQFFDSMYNLTKAMPQHLQMKVRRKMFEAVTEAEEEIFSNPQSSSMKSSGGKNYGFLC